MSRSANSSTLCRFTRKVHLNTRTVACRASTVNWDISSKQTPERGARVAYTRHEYHAQYKGEGRPASSQIFGRPCLARPCVEHKYGLLSALGPRDSAAQETGNSITKKRTCQ